MNKTARAANRQAWIQRLERFQQANQSVAQFCQTEGVSIPSFYQWRQKLNAKRSTPDTTAVTKFLPVRLPNDTHVTAKPKTVLSIDLPAGVHQRKRQLYLPILGDAGRPILEREIMRYLFCLIFWCHFFCVRG